MSNELKKTLGPVMIWGLGVGYVISGDYFGWNLGLAEGGPVGLLVATLFVTLMYVCFVMSYAELSCAIPRAGGAFVYATRGLGRGWGYLAGVAQIIEFVFAPPAIAAAIGAYFNIFFPEVPVIAIAIAAYVLFTGINIYGVHFSAVLELIVTVLAVGELLLFGGITLPHFTWAAFLTDPLPNGASGIFAAIPFAIWFYLAIEGIANVAEEAKNPQKDISKGFLAAMTTLVFLAMLVFFSSVGVNGWREVVFAPGSETPSDSPLPLAMAHVLGTDHIFYHLLIAIGLFGLIASFHGIMLAAGRATFEFGREGYAPRFLGKTLEKRKTPAAALILNMGVGILALFTGKTGEIIIMAVFGALTLYIVSIFALFALRKNEPGLVRPYVTPLYPAAPLCALTIAGVCLVAMFWYNFQIGLVYLSMVAAGYCWYFVFVRAVAK